jgi:hypothetical protein
MDCVKYCGKKHTIEVEIQKRQRNDFLHGMGRYQSRVLIFLEDLKEVPSFPMWIRSAIFGAIKDGRNLIKTHCTCPCHQH